MTVDPQNDAPVEAAGLADQTILEDQPDVLVPLGGAFDDVDIAEQGDALTYGVVGNTLGGVIIATIDGNDVRLETVANASGNGTITVEATDIGGLSTTTDFDVTVDPVNDDPTEAAGFADQVLQEDQAAVLLPIGGAFVDLDGDLLDYTVANNGLAAALNATIDAGSVRLETIADQAGTGTITIRAEDPSGGSAESDFDVTVNAENDAPFVDLGIADQNLNEDQGAVNVALTNAFDDADLAAQGDNLAYAVTGNTVGAALVANIAANSVVLTPTPDMVGNGAVTVTATDSQGASVATSFNVDIAAVNDGPVRVADPVVPVVVEDGGTFSIDFTGVFTDIDLANGGDSHTLTMTGAAPAAFITNATSLNAIGGVLDFTYPQDVNGVVNIAVTVEDDAGSTATAAFAVHHRSAGGTRRWLPCRFRIK